MLIALKGYLLIFQDDVDDDVVVAIHFCLNQIVE